MVAEGDGGEGERAALGLVQRGDAGLRAVTPRALPRLRQEGARRGREGSGPQQAVRGGSAGREDVPQAVREQERAKAASPGAPRAPVPGTAAMVRRESCGTAVRGIGLRAGPRGRGDA